MDTMAAGKYGHATLMVSYGGEIVQRSSEGGRPTYAGGHHQLVKVRRSSSLRELHDRLAAIVGCFRVALKYVCPGEPDALRDVETADDVRNLLDWVLLRDLQVQLYRRDLQNQLPGADSPVKVIPRVRVFVVSLDVRPPLPEWLFSVAPTKPIVAPSSSPVAPPARASVSPSSLQKRSASAPSLSACSADDTSKPPSPSLIQRSASASTLTLPSPEYDTANPITTTAAAAAAAAGNTRITQEAAPFPATMQKGPAPVFLVPVAPAMLYHPVIPVYQGFLVPAGWRNVVLLCEA